jgi:dihydrofolate synthase/folylpolyglutamate synthase
LSTAHQAPILFSSLEAWLSHLETAHPVGIDMGLERISRVKAALGLQFDCPVITVAGTNGKGSTCAYLESILISSGYRVGCHMSPHLLKFNERAKVNGEEVSDAFLLEHFTAVEHARVSLVDAPTLTYFEFTTLAIMHLFTQAHLDAVVLEVGMGGRLDAVNIVDADCAIVTSIDIDHAGFLGATREAIALEKAGIFRTGQIAICGDPIDNDNTGEYKTNFEWEMETEDGDVFTIYDWKEYRPLGYDEMIVWHIGGHSKEITDKALQELLNNYNLANGSK